MALPPPLARPSASSWRGWGTAAPGLALIYLHDSDERQRKLAEALGDAALAELQRRGSRSESGADLARDDHNAG